MKNTTARKQKMIAVAERIISEASSKWVNGWGSPQSRCARLADLMIARLNANDFTGALTLLLQLNEASYG